MHLSTRPPSSLRPGFATLLAVFALGAALLAMPAQAQNDLAGVVINEILADPNSATINFDTDGDGTAEDADEFVELHNTSGTAVNISGWEIWDDAGAVNNPRHVFPAGTEIPAGGFVAVVGNHNTPPDGFFDASSGSLGLNNGGDTVYLFIPSPGAGTFMDPFIAAAFNGDTPTNTPPGVPQGMFEAFGNDVDGQSIQRRPDGSTTFVVDTPNPAATNSPPPPGPVVVNTLSDENDTGSPNAFCSLREAVLSTNTDTSVGGCTYAGQDVIAFSVAGTITLVFGSDLDVTDSVMIDSDGLITVSGGAASRPDGGPAPGFGGGASRIFDVVAGTLTLEEITLVDGQADRGGLVLVRAGATLIADQVNFVRGNAFGVGGGAIFIEGVEVGFSGLGGGTASLSNGSVGNSVVFITGGSGGGIFNNGGTLTLDNMFVEANSAASFGGLGGGIYNVNGGIVTITNGSTIQTNLANEGGGLWNNAVVEIDDESSFMTNAATEGNGGGIFNTGGSLTLDNAAIEGNTADAGEVGGQGGGIFNDGGTLTITGGTINDNNATFSGGGIFIDESSDVDITDAEISGNGESSGDDPSPRRGGGIFNGGGMLDIGASTISNNFADDEGGGLWNSSAGTLTINGGEISGNTANGDLPTQGGGGIFNNGGTVNLQFVTISSNFAPGTAGSGGGIFNAGGPLSITSGAISGNGAHRAGGGIEIAGGDLTLLNGQVTNNFIPPDFANPGNGGGIHLGGGSADIDGGVFSGNSAAEGGGLWNDSGGTLTITGTTISGNGAAGNDPDQGGGGIFNDGGSVTITDATLTSNFAPGTSGSGGGILNNGGTLTINGGSVSGNGAHRAGGGIEIAGGDLVTNDVLITGNFIPPDFANPGNGGGIHIGGGTADINGGSFTNNSAAEGGGLWSSAPITIEPLPDGPPVDISGNTAFGDAPDQGGGGIFFTGPTAPVLNDVIIIDNQATGTEGSGGGLFIEGPTQVTINTSTISGNMANRAGGGIEILTPAGAPDLAILHLVRSTVDGNSFDTPNPGNGGGLHITGHALAQVEQSTFSNNTAEEGGGLWNSSSGFIGLLNSTVSGNIANGDGGGVIAFTGLERPAHGDAAREAVTDDLAESTSGLFLGFVELSSTTVTNNTAGQAGGGLHEGGAGVPVQGDDSVFILQNSLIGDNSAPSGPDCFGLFQSGDHNLIEDVAGCAVIGDVGNNVIGQDPLLGPLDDNGGPTQTHALLDGSPAISAGNSVFSVDQREVPRDNEDDIGAFESDLVVAVGPCPEALIISDFAAFADGNAFELRNTGAVPAPLAGCSFVGTYNDVYVALDLGDGSVLPGATVGFAPGEQFRNVFGGLALVDREEVPAVGTTISAIQPDIIASLVYLGHDVVYGFYHRNTESFAAQCLDYAPDRLGPFAQSQCFEEAERGTGDGSLDGPVALGHAELTAAMLTAERGATVAEGDALPTAFALSAAYPNPLSQRGTLTVDVPEAADVRVVVYDVLGRAVAVLLDEAVEAGRYAVSLDASSLAPGTYLVRLAAGGFAQTRRMTVVR